MNLPIVLACLWLIAANVIAMLPSRDRHWRAAFMLIVVGIPILGFVTWKTGPVGALIFLAAAISVLRWPVFYLFRLVRGRQRG